MDRNRAIITIGSLAVVAATTATASLTGLERHWLDGNGGSFDDALNWVDGDTLGVPGPDDTAIFDIGDLDGAVQFSSAALNRRLIIRSGDVIFDIAPGSYALAETAPLDPAIVIGDTPTFAPQLEVNGGALDGRFVEVGSTIGAFGALDVVGTAASVIAEGQLRVGAAGLGFLDVSDAAVVTSAFGDMGATSSGTGFAAVSGPGSSWSAPTRLTVGHAGFGSLIIDDAAQVDSGPMVIGQQNGSVGAVVVRDPETSLFVGGSLDVGLVGIGELEVTDGAYVSVDSFLSIATSATDWPDTEFSDGSVRVDADASLVVEGPVLVGLIGNGELVLARGGRLLGGDEVDADFTGGTLRLELGGSGDYATAAISAVGAINPGNIEVSLVEGFVPSAGDVFEVLASDTSVIPPGYALPPLPAGLAWSPITTADSSTLTVTGGLAGDVDGDGDVDIDDMLAVLGAWGPCPGCAADLDDDDDVDVDDLLIVLGSFGS